MTRNSNYKSLNSLMRHIRDSSGIRIGGGSDKRALAQMGYFHGYKGYRYSGTATKRIPYSGFDELRAVVDFDTNLKRYSALTDELRSRVPVRIFDMIVHTDNRAKIAQLERWVRSR